MSTAMRWRAIYATGPEVEFDATDADVRDFHERLGRLASYSRVWLALGLNGLDTLGLRAIVPVVELDETPIPVVRAKDVRKAVNAVLARSNRPLRICEVVEQIDGSNYCTVRTILHRGIGKGDYRRTGHRYSLADGGTAPDAGGPAAGGGE